MEVLYNKLKKKDVVSLSDGKNLGRVCDLAFLYPQNTVKGYYVTGCKGFKFNRQDIFIPVANIVKIGEDVILTNYSDKPADKPPKGVQEGQTCGSLSNNCCPPPNQNQPCPPNPNSGLCPPPNSNNCCPPNKNNGCPPNKSRPYNLGLDDDE
jgi:sporulation protein YlmC with PRC-barrel domain